MRLTSEMLEGLDPEDDLAFALKDFEALDYPAGRRAREWLGSCVEKKEVPLETYLAFGDDPRRLLGFYAIRPAAFALSREDTILLVVRRTVEEGPQPGAMLELIARAKGTSSGFGDQLVIHALANTMAAEAVALLVEADKEVAARVWTRHRFMSFKPERRARRAWTTLLWHPVDAPKGGDWPS
jgi:hypothetical protein